jgi:hypothetical protein
MIFFSYRRYYQIRLKVVVHQHRKVKQVRHRKRHRLNQVEKRERQLLVLMLKVHKHLSRDYNE